MQLRTEVIIIVRHANFVKITKIGSDYIGIVIVGGQPGSLKGAGIFIDHCNSCHMGVIIDLDFKHLNCNWLEPLEPTNRLAPQVLICFGMNIHGDQLSTIKKPQ